MIATGAAYRKPQCEKLPHFEGAGVYYAATPMEAQLCQGEEVIVVGGGNAAGQAAVFLAESAERIHMLVRSASLVDKMSRYLIRRIEETPKIVFRPYTEIIALQGDDHLESVSWRNNQTGLTEWHNIRHVFLMTGADPNTDWLDGCIALDSKGFIKTGLDLSTENLVLHTGLLLVHRTCSKPVYRGSLQWATYKAAASSVLRPLWVKDQLQSHLFIKYLQE